MKSFRQLLLEYLDDARVRLRNSPLLVVLTIGVAFAIYFLLVEVGPWNLAMNLHTLRVASAALIFGIFLGVILISEQMSSPLESTLVRVFAGIVAGPTIALIFNATIFMALGAAFVGALIGYFGHSWANHI